MFISAMLKYKEIVNRARKNKRQKAALLLYNSPTGL